MDNQILPTKITLKNTLWSVIKIKYRVLTLRLSDSLHNRSFRVEPVEVTMLLIEKDFLSLVVRKFCINFVFFCIFV